MQLQNRGDESLILNIIKLKDWIIAFGNSKGILDERIKNYWIPGLNIINYLGKWEIKWHDKTKGVIVAQINLEV